MVLVAGSVGCAASDEDLGQSELGQGEFSWRSAGTGGACAGEGCAESIEAVAATPGDDRPRKVQCYTSSLVCDALCCVNATAPSFECGTTARSCPGNGGGVQATARCDGPEDCPTSRECCQDLYGSRSCQTSCSVMTVCHVDEDCPSGTCDARGECDPVN